MNQLMISLLDKLNCKIVMYDFKTIDSLVYKKDDTYIIGISRSIDYIEPYIAHELSHILSCTFYQATSKGYRKIKCERIANDTACLLFPEYAKKERINLEKRKGLKSVCQYINSKTVKAGILPFTTMERR